ncbi:MAG: transposase [Elusimicrobia bacterium]|nr:transposase [Elusimicrobiota bacterium]
MGVKKKHIWTVSEKLEIVAAREKGLTLHEVSELYGVCVTSIYEWTKAYKAKGIAGLERAPKGCSVESRSSRVEAAEKVLEGVLKENPEAGIGKAQGALYRHGFLGLARETVRRLLRGLGHGPRSERFKKRNRPVKHRFFERANPNELWQSDIMTFMLKGQYRIYLIGFMDDHSRFITGWGLYRFQTSVNVQEVFRAAIEKHGLPKEVLTDNGRQYYTWRGKSKFSEMLLKLGIRHIRSRPYHPQTLGKIESFWRNLLQESLNRMPLSTFEEARDKIGEYIEYYNFKRPHQGIGNLTPSDRFYKVGEQVKQIIEANTAKIEETAGPVTEYTAPAYIVGNIGGRELRVVAKEAEVRGRSPVIYIKHKRKI